jgi:hypothetical protein
MLPQFLDRRMIVVGDLVGKGKLGRIEDTRLAAEGWSRRAVSSTTSRE